MTGRHSATPRGLLATKNSPLFQGRFGRMFRTLRPARFGRDDDESVGNLAKLAGRMIADFDLPKDGKDEEESGIPALYTYLGQFIDHDLTFDPTSSLQAQNDPDALVDFRSPALDLDNIYGRGPSDQPYMYEKDGMHFGLGVPLLGGDPTKDLLRNQLAPQRALIGDPRNDENSIVSQLQGLFLRFHNRMVDDHPGLPFDEIQRLVRFHYQYVVVNDFLSQIVSSRVLDALRENGAYRRHNIEFFRWKHHPFMPVEFAGAAYRHGHSMVRPGYRLNDAILLPIFPVPAQGLPEGLTGFRAMNPQWGIDWGRFIDVELRQYEGQDKRRLQLAYRIDTSLVNSLGNLPTAVAANPSSLAERNLTRGFRLGLPSGQAVAKAMGVKPLHDSEILIGKAVDDVNGRGKPITDVSSVFANNCPLWTYVLAEAAHFAENVQTPTIEKTVVTTPKLGPVGGRIVAEVILGLLFGDPNSYLTQEPNWHPAQGQKYRLADFVKFALGR